MEQRKFTPAEMEKIIRSIDGISKAEAPPFFYTRLQAKLDRQLPGAAYSVWMLVTKPAVSLITLSLLLVLNIAVIRTCLKAPAQNVSENTSGLERFAQEYDLNGTSVYTNKTTR